MRYELIATPHYSDPDPLLLRGGLGVQPDSVLVGMTIRVERDDGAFAQFEIGKSADPHMLTVGVGTAADRLHGLRALVDDANELHEARTRVRRLHTPVAADWDEALLLCVACRDGYGAHSAWPCETMRAIGE